MNEKKVDVSLKSETERDFKDCLLMSAKFYEKNFFRLMKISIEFETRLVVTS